MNWFWLFTHNREEGCHWIFWFVTGYNSPSATFSNWFGKFLNTPQSRIGPFQFSSVWPVRKAVRGRFADDEVKEAVHDPLHNQQQTFLFNGTIKFANCSVTVIKESIHSFSPLTCAECDDSLPFSGASSIPLCFVPLLPSFSTNKSSILPHFILPSISWSMSQPRCFQKIFGEFYFLPFSVHAQTNVISLTLLSLLTIA